MADPNPQAEAVHEEGPTFTVIEKSTEQGFKTLVDSRGYSYNVKREGKLVTAWCCVIRNKKVYCRATVAQSKDNFEEGLHEHGHPPTSGLEAAYWVKQTINEKTK